MDKWKPVSSRYFTVPVAVIISLFVAELAFVSASGPFPTIFAPHSLAATVPLILGSSNGLSFLIAFCTSMIVLRKLLTDATLTRIDSLDLTIGTIISIGSTFDLLLYWKVGCYYQGREVMVANACYNLIFFLAAIAILSQIKQRVGTVLVVTFKTVLLSWAFWCAIPWIGETLW